MIQKTHRVFRKTKMNVEQSSSVVGSILEATRNLLNEKDLESTSTNQIAKNAGVSIGSLYQYFWNKNGIASALVRKEVAQNVLSFRAEMQKAEKLSLHDKTVVLVDFVIDRIVANPVLLERMFRPIPTGVIFQFVIQARVEVAHEIEKVLRNHQDELNLKDPLATSFFVVNLVCQMMNFWFHLTKSEVPIPISKELFRQHLIQSVLACWKSSDS